MRAYYIWGRIIHGSVLYIGAYYTWGRIIHGGVLYMGAYYIWGRTIYGTTKKSVAFANQDSKLEEVQIHISISHSSRGRQ